MPDFAVTEKKKNELILRMEKLGIKESALDEKFVRGSGRGGQKINKTASCVVLKHKPSGIVVKCQRERERSINRFLARRLLADKLEVQATGQVKSKQDKADKIRKQKKRRRRRSVISTGNPVDRGK